MKSSNLLLAGLLLLSSTAIAQSDSSGIYLTATDFQNKVLSYAINCATETHAIRLKNSGAYVTLVHRGEKIRLDKNRLYGAKLCSGATYRIVDRLAYEILNPTDGLLLYRRQVVSSAKNPVPPKYFFSASIDGQLLELTIQNLKTAFPDNHRFHDQLDGYFKDDRSLLEFDAFHRQYKLVRFFLQSGEQPMIN